MADTYRILSLDGGGIRGVLTAQILARLVQSKPDLIAKFDMIAGTSTGSILTCGLAGGMKPEEIVSVYESEGPQIFKTDWWKKIGFLGMILTAKYNTKNRLNALRKTFGDKKLGDFAQSVFISTFLLDDQYDPAPKGNARKQPRWKAKFFHNLVPKDGGDYRNELAVDVVMRSSAAPLYFPIFQHYVDGGVVANNPSMCAYSQVLDVNTPVGVGKEIQILSVGTGSNAQVVASASGNWGLKQWGFNLVDIVTGGQVGLADYQCKQILGDASYCRIDPDLKVNIPLDDVSKIPELLKIAQGCDLTKALAFIGSW